MPNSSSHSVIVIGAGISGVKAAADLTRAGVNVLMLEARGRTGGRINTDRASGGTYDMGASWLHETLVNELFKDAVGKTELYYDDCGYSWYDEHGEIPPTERCHKVIDEMMQSVEMELSSSKPDQSIIDYAKDFVQTRPLITDRQKEVVPKMARLWELFYGTPSHAISARAGGVEHMGRNAYVVSGFDTIFQRVFDQVDQSRLDLRLNTEVTQINYDSSDIVTVTTSDGHRYLASHLICTIPLGVMRHKPHLFGFTLPSPLKYAISSPVYGALGKVFLEFDHVFWKTDMHRFVVLGEYTNDPAKPKPFDCPVFFTNGHLIFGRPCLVSLVAPPLTQYLEANPDKIVEYYEPLLEVLRVDKSKPLPRIKSYKITDWTLDPYAYGTYSSIPMGETLDTVVMPFIHGYKNIRFAGEHATYTGNGCTHGAYAAGKREAAHVLRQLHPHSRL